MSEILKGTITGFGGSWGSGLGFLGIDGAGIPCENAQTVRALEGAFGDVIAEGHTVNVDAIVGKEIYYSVDDVGILDGFTPVDEATDELVEAYEAGQEEEEEEEQEECSRCDGSGLFAAADWYSDAIKCDDCNGTGYEPLKGGGE